MKIDRLCWLLALLWLVVVVPAQTSSSSISLAIKRRQRWWHTHLAKWFTGTTGLHQAARRGNTGAVRRYLSTGARVQDRDWWSRATPLLVAARHQHNAVLNQLLAAAPPNILPVNGKDRRGRTALHFAAQTRNVDAIRALLRHGADSDVRDREGNTPLQYLLEDPRQVSVLCQVFLEAAAEGDWERLKRFVQQYSPVLQCSVAEADRRGDGPSRHVNAVQKAASAGHVAVLEWLLPQMGDLDVSEFCAEELRPVLQAAMHLGNADMVLRVLQSATTSPNENAFWKEMHSLVMEQTFAAGNVSLLETWIHNEIFVARDQFPLVDDLLRRLFEEMRMAEFRRLLRIFVYQQLSLFRESSFRVDPDTIQSIAQRILPYLFALFPNPEDSLVTEVAVPSASGTAVPFRLDSFRANAADIRFYHFGNRLALEMREMNAGFSFHSTFLPQAIPFQVSGTITDIIARFGVVAGDERRPITAGLAHLTTSQLIARYGTIRVDSNLTGIHSASDLVQLQLVPVLNSNVIRSAMSQLLNRALNHFQRELFTPEGSLSISNLFLERHRMQLQRTLRSIVIEPAV